MEKSKKRLFKKMLVVFLGLLTAFSVFGIAAKAQKANSASAAGLVYESDWLGRGTGAYAQYITNVTSQESFFYFKGFTSANLGDLTYIGSPINISGEYFDILFKFSSSSFVEGDTFGFSLVDSPVASRDERFNIVFRYEGEMLRIAIHQYANFVPYSQFAYAYNEDGTKNYYIGGRINGKDYMTINLDTTSYSEAHHTEFGYINFRIYYGYEESKIVVDTRYPSYWSEEGIYRYREYDYDEGYERPQEIFVPGSYIRPSWRDFRNNTVFGQLWSLTSNVCDHVGLRFGAGTFEYDYSLFTKEAAELRRQIDEKNSLITALQATTATLRERELELTESINTLDSRIASLQADYNNNLDEIITLRAEKMALEKQLEVVNSQNAQYASQLATTTKELETLTVKLTGAEEGEEKVTEPADKDFFESVGEWIFNNVLYTVLICIGLILIFATPILILIDKKKRS